MENKNSVSQPNTPGSVRSPPISPIIVKNPKIDQKNSVSFPNINTLLVYSKHRRNNTALVPPPVPDITPPPSPCSTPRTPSPPTHHFILPPPPSSHIETKESSQTPLDILYEHIVRLTVRKLQTNITTSVKSDNGNISELTVVLMSKPCSPISNRLLDIAFFVSFATNTTNYFNAMVDFRISELVPPRNIIDTDSFNKQMYTDMTGKRFSMINTIDIKSCPATSIKCKNIFKYFENINNVFDLVREVVTKDIIKEYILMAECIQCSDLYISDKSTGPVMTASCPDLVSPEANFRLCQRCETNYRIAKENNEIDNSIPETCCVCMEKQYVFDSESFCTNPAHSIHKSCAKRMSENGDTRCPLCRQRRDSEISYDDD